MNQEKFDQVFDDLAPQQRKVLLRLLDEKTDKEIAKSLQIAETTVRKTIEEICKKFKCEPDERRRRRPHLINLFRKYKPELVKECTPSDTSEVMVVETARGEDSSASGVQNCSSNTDTSFVERESAIVNSSLPVNNSASAQQDYKETRQRGVWIPNTRCRQVWGRDNLIEQILNRLDDPQELSILSLSGGAGYGKTEAASEIAKKALNRNLFADVLWVTARQTELVDGLISQEQRCGALNWNKFLHEIAHQLACPVERVQRHLREEKLLLILDNAETANVEDILTNLVKMLNPSRVLLTSRLKTNLQFVRLIPIQGLDETSAHQLLRDEARNKDIPILLQASNEQLHRVHQLSCGAPLALHFIVGRAWDDRVLEPVLLALEQASGEVEVFYEFSLNTAWQRISDVAKCVLRYMGRADAGVTWGELSGAWGVLESDWGKAQRELRRWYLIEDVQDIKGNPRYDLHPWVRSSVRGGLVDNWQPSLQDLKQITRWKYDL